MRKRMVWGGLAAVAAALLLVVLPRTLPQSQVAVGPDVNGERIETRVAEKVEPRQQASKIAAVKNPPAISEIETPGIHSVAPLPVVATSDSVEPAKPVRVATAPDAGSSSTSSQKTPVAAGVGASLARKARSPVDFQNVNNTEALIAFSSDDDNLFEEVGISTDEDGLYAIKL